MKHVIIKVSCAFIFLFVAGNIIGQNTYPYPATGNIGIGTASPLATLHVAAGANNTALLLQGDNFFSIKVKTYTGGTFVTTHRVSQVYSNDVVDRNGFIDFIRGGDNAGGAMALGSNGTERIRIAPSGNVGIGTPTPAGILDVLATSAGTDPQIFFRGQVSGANQNSNSPRLNLTGMDQTAGFGMQAINMGGYGVKDLVFSAHNASDYTTYTEVVRFKYNGNVGIGTANPANKLDVAGSGGWSIINCQALDNNTTTRLKFTNSNNRTWSISNLAPPYANNDFSIADETANAVRLFINNAGNVGIGTVAPGTNRLAVEGTIAARKVKVTSAVTWPDYVFDTAYNLLPLDKVQDFISQNKHLPDVPSAAHIEKNGLDLGDNQAILLRKIEELTLYLIQQQKELKEQRGRILELENKQSGSPDNKAVIQGKK